MLVLDGAGQAGHYVLVEGAEVDSGTAVAEGAALQCSVDVEEVEGVWGVYLFWVQGRA